MKIALKFFILLPFILIGTMSNGQIQIKAGLGLSYGTEAATVGLHFRGDVDLNEQWTGSMNIITYLGPNFGDEDFSGIGGIKATYWELNFDAHYNAIISDDMTIYPLAGLNLSTAGVKTTLNIPFGGSFGDTETKVGLNIGGGLNYLVAERISILGEIKYVISDFDQLVITGGALYHF